MSGLWWRCGKPPWGPRVVSVAAAAGVVALRFKRPREEEQVEQCNHSDFLKTPREWGALIEALQGMLKETKYIQEISANGVPVMNKVIDSSPEMARRASSLLRDQGFSDQADRIDRALEHDERGAGHTSPEAEAALGYSARFRGSQAVHRYPIKQEGRGWYPRAALLHPKL
jgi:hypothetical protein